MPKNTKTQKVAVYPDGTRYPLRFREGCWWWTENAGSFPLAAAIDNVKAAGGHIVTEPNPAYRPPETELRKLFGRAFGYR